MENVMAYIRLPLGIRVAMEYEVFGKVVVNVYHVTTPDPIITIKLLDIAQIFETWWDGDMSANFGADIELTGVTVTNLNEANGEQVVLAVIPPVPGGVLGEIVPNNVALVTTLNTAKTGRSFRGRSYAAGLPRGQIVGNTVNAGTVAAILLDYALLDAALGADDNTLVIASFISGGAPRAEGVATPVDSFSADSRVDTQRRRLPAV